MDTGKIGRGFFLILALVCVLRTANAGEYHHDGNWWRTLTYADKLAYMTGFIDGAVSVAVDKKTGNPFSSSDTAEQWVRDLDSSYEKPENRRFTVPLVFGDIDKLKGGRR